MVRTIDILMAKTKGLQPGVYDVQHTSGIIRIVVAKKTRWAKLLVAYPELWMVVRITRVRDQP